MIVSMLIYRTDLYVFIYMYVYVNICLCVYIYCSQDSHYYIYEIDKLLNKELSAACQNV